MVNNDMSFLDSFNVMGLPFVMMSRRAVTRPIKVEDKFGRNQICPKHGVKHKHCCGGVKK